MPDSFSFQQFERIAREIDAMSAVIGVARNGSPYESQGRPGPAACDQIPAAAAELVETSGNREAITEANDEGLEIK